MICCPCTDLKSNEKGIKYFTFSVSFVITLLTPFKSSPKVSLVFLLLLIYLWESFLLPFRFLSNFSSSWVWAFLIHCLGSVSIFFQDSQIPSWITSIFLHFGLVRRSFSTILAMLAQHSVHQNEPFLSFEKINGSLKFNKHALAPLPFRAASFTSSLNKTRAVILLLAFLASFRILNSTISWLLQWSLLSAFTSLTSSSFSVSRVVRNKI